MSGSAARARPWLWFGLALVPVLAALVWWTLADGPRESTRSSSGSGADEGGGSAASSSALGRGLGRGWSGTEVERGARLEAIVVSDEQDTLGEGRVELRCAGTGPESGASGAPRYARIDAEGRFVAEACPSPGPTCVRLVHGHFEQPEAWELDAGREHELRVELGPRWAGRVRSVEGEVIASASILVTSERGRGTATQTDAAGTFELIAPRPRPCDACDASAGSGPGQGTSCRDPAADAADQPARILVLAPRFAPVEHELAPASSSAPVEIELPEPAPPISGRVLGRDGVPFVDRTSVLAVNIARESEAHATTTDTRGQFAFTSLARGRYRIRAVRDGLELARVELAEPGDTLALEAGFAGRGHTLALAIVDAQGQPIREVRVDGGPFRGARVGQSGTIEAASVAPGTYPLSIRAPTCPVLRVRLVVEPDAPARVEERITLSDCPVSK